MFSNDDATPETKLRHKFWSALDDSPFVMIGLKGVEADIWEAAKGATLKAAAMKALFNVDPGKKHSKDHRATVEL